MEYKKCIVSGEPALFHCWTSTTYCGECALVEFDDGSMTMIRKSNIKFEEGDANAEK